MRAAGSFCWRSAFSAAPTRWYRALGRARRAGRGLSSSPRASLFLLLHGTDLSSSPRGCKRRGKYLFCLGGSSQGDRSVTLKDLNPAICCFLLIPSQMLMSGGPSSSRQAQADCWRSFLPSVELLPSAAQRQPTLHLSGAGSP